jgi:hypothetical protein
MRYCIWQLIPLLCLGVFAIFHCFCSLRGLVIRDFISVDNDLYSMDRPFRDPASHNNWAYDSDRKRSFSAHEEKGLYDWEEGREDLSTKSRSSEGMGGFSFNVTIPTKIGLVPERQKIKSVARAWSTECGEDTGDNIPRGPAPRVRLNSRGLC